jgi:mono/diheme cytochrome c family protein
MFGIGSARLRSSVFHLAAAAVALPSLLGAQSAPAPLDITFSRDIAPILQRSCQVCHNPVGVAPMSLVSYSEVRRYAPLIKYRTGLRDRAGAMPPYYVERNIGIQHYKDDLRLSDAEVAAIAAWVDAGAPEGNPRDLPPAREWDDGSSWAFGEPDLVVKTQDFFVPAGAPDWWGNMETVPTGLTENRYVRAVQIREVNDFVTGGQAAQQAAGHSTSVGGRWIVHHMIWSTRGGAADADDDDDAALGGATSWPVHELGRNPDVFDPRAGRILRAGSSVVSSSVHLHSNGRDTRGHLEIGFYFHPVGYEPEYRRAGVGLGDGMNIDIRGGESGQELHAYTVLNQHTKITSFEPHLHAPGQRMCLEAIWGMQIETLSCTGYDHNWVRQYTYDDDHAPLLPRGTILHIVGYMDNSPSNPNIPDPRNWQGSGNRSVTNMFIDLGNRVALTDEQFVEEMANRRERLGLTVNDHVIGCPLCMANIPRFEPKPPADPAAP